MTAACGMELLLVKGTAPIHVDLARMSAQHMLDMPVQRDSIQMCTAQLPARGVLASSGDPGSHVNAVQRLPNR